MSTETWYILEDGSCADPREIASGADGVLRHKDGRAVEYKPHGPRTRGVDPEEERAKAAAPRSAKVPAKPKVESKDMRPEESKPGYITREAKTE